MTHQMSSIKLRGFHHVVRAASAAAGNGTASAPASGGGEGAASAYKAVAACKSVLGSLRIKPEALSADNSLYANDLALALLLGVGAFFLAAAPAMSIWFSSGRFTQGWTLTSKKTNRAEEWERSRGLSRVVSMQGVAMPASVRAISAWCTKYVAIAG